MILFMGDLSLRSSPPFCLIVDRVLPERIFVKYLFIAPTFGDIDISLSLRILAYLSLDTQHDIALHMTYQQ